MVRLGSQRGFIVVVVLATVLIGMTDPVKGSPQQEVSPAAPCIAIMFEGTIATSADGATWVSHNIPGSDTMEAVALTSDRMVAVYDGEEEVNRRPPVRISTDGGVTWRAPSGPRLKGHGPYLMGIATNGEQWVSVGWNGAILYSADAETWRPVQKRTNLELVSVATDGTTWVAVGNDIDNMDFGTGVILTSQDGRHWQSKVVNYSVDLVAWNGTQWLVSGTEEKNGETVGLMLTSPDAKVWTRHPPTADWLALDLAWSGSEWLTVGRGIASSTDGVQWTWAADTYAYDYVGWAGTRWVATEEDDSGEFTTIVTSSDGVQWTPATAPIEDTAVDIASTCPPAKYAPPVRTPVTTTNPAEAKAHLAALFVPIPGFEYRSPPSDQGFTTNAVFGEPLISRSVVTTAGRRVGVATLATPEGAATDTQADLDDLVKIAWANIGKDFTTTTIASQRIRRFRWGNRWVYMWLRGGTYGQVIGDHRQSIEKWLTAFLPTLPTTPRAVP